MVASLAVVTSRPGTVSLRPVADTTLFESAPNDNLGGWTHFVAGTTGNQGDRTRNRGLLRFDIASAVPGGARITTAQLTLEVVRVPGSAGGGGPASSVFGLHRVLRPWGEGDKLGDRGFPADAGEATWNFRFAFDQPWANPGAVPGADFIEAASATAMVGGKSRYGFGPTPSLAADVQTWLDHPADNHGWLVVSQSEATSKTARAFGSREDAGHAPQLLIEFESPTPLTLAIARVAPDKVRVSFMSRAGHTYQLEAAHAVAGATWQTVASWSAGLGGPLAADQDVVGTACFYRLREE